MAQSATESNGKANVGYEDLSRQIETLKADLSGLADLIGGLGKTEGERLVAEARSRGEEMKAAGEARYARVRDTTEGYLREGERYVREQPGTALGIAAALGFLAGFVLTTRR